LQTYIAQNGKDKDTLILDTGALSWSDYHRFLKKKHPGVWQSSLHSGSAHDLSLSGALQLGRKLGMDIPEDTAIKIIAIQVEDVQTLGEKLTPEVEAGIPQAVERILTLLKEWTSLC